MHLFREKSGKKETMENANKKRSRIRRKLVLQRKESFLIKALY